MSWRADKKARDHIRSQDRWVMVRTVPSLARPHGWRSVADLLREVLGMALDPKNAGYKDHWVWFLDKENDYAPDQNRVVCGLPNDGLPIYKRGGRHGKDAYMMNLQVLNMQGLSNLPQHTHMVMGILDTGSTDHGTKS